MTPSLAVTCDQARAGWPCDESMETVRRATSPAELRQIAERAQVLNTTVVTHIPLGEWYAVSAVRSSAETLPTWVPVSVSVPVPVSVSVSVPVFWGLTKR